MFLQLEISEYSQSQLAYQERSYLEGHIYKPERHLLLSRSLTNICLRAISYSRVVYAKGYFSELLAFSSLNLVQ